MRRWVCTHAWNLTGVAALAAIFLVVLFGTTKDPGQDARVARVACSSADWNGKTLAYFDGAARRLDSRIGTNEETSTDRAARAQIQILLDAGTQYARDLGRDCGDPIPLPKEK